MLKHIYLFFMLIIVIPSMTPLTVYAAPLSLESASLLNETTIPPIYTCVGKNISPSLEWKNSPENTKSFSLILSDPDAPGGTFYHWVLYNIPSTTYELKEGIQSLSLPAGAQIGKNSWGDASYKGPCPPPGREHQYIFTLYALNIQLTTASASNADANTVLRAMQNHILATAEMKYTFKR